MLLSPGHSPRHLSSPSPSPSLSEKPQQNRNSSSVLNVSANPRKEVTVLDEDTYVAAIEKIVERDFFPDIPKLRDRLEWLEAVRSGDPLRIRDMMILRLCRYPSISFSGGILVRIMRVFENLEKANRKRKERYEFLTEGEKEDVKLIEDVKRDRITDGYGTSDQPPKRLNGLTKEVNLTNTRFHGKLMDSRPKDEDTVAVLYTPIPGATPVPLSLSEREGDKSKKYDLEDLRKTPNPFYVESRKRADNGTPLRLEPEDTPIGIGGSGDGPHFKIPCPPSRDLKAHSLSREAARKLRERSKMFQKPPLPSPVRGGSASPSVRTLSHAAQKFVRNAIAKSSCSVDESLRASYRGASPGISTPKSGRSMSRFGRDGSTSTRKYPMFHLKFLMLVLEVSLFKLVVLPFMNLLHVSLLVHFIVLCVLQAEVYQTLSPLSLFALSLLLVRGWIAVASEILVSISGMVLPQNWDFDISYKRRDQVYGVYLHGSLGLQLCSSSGLMAPDIAVLKIPFTIDQPYHCLMVSISDLAEASRVQLQKNHVEEVFQIQGMLEVTHIQWISPCSTQTFNSQAQPNATPLDVE
ncbi:hypothetical protein CK203_073911 [Vitis vinifera]|uniref:Uncharacterized protein n=1 Tax=Vitis vinifera TaxID=29760 RepID=A0A438DQ09_VITVI|nr:hypothetical protein CK203_073911 [Vitis vinifera]